MPIPNPPHKIACPKCGSRDLEMRRLSVIEQALVAPVIAMAEALRRRVR